MPEKLSKTRPALKYLLVFAIGIIINTLFLGLTYFTGIKLYLDGIGTALAAMLGGAVPAVFVGFATNIIGLALDSMKIYFGLVNVLLAVMVAILAKRNAFSRIYKTLLSALAISVVCAVLSAAITWYINGYAFGEGITTPIAEKIYATGRFSAFISLLLANFCIEGADKFVSIIVAALIYKYFPARLKRDYFVSMRDYKRAGTGKKGVSIATKFAVIIVALEIILGTVAAGAGHYIYRNIAVRNYTEKCRGVSETAAASIDGDRVDEYLALNGETEDYKETEELFYELQDAFPHIQYVYAYKIMNDGCHVVFDIDSGEEEGKPTNYVESFEEGFDDYRDDLLAGREIEPLITDDEYGWLLTVYTPVYNSEGECVCYAAADIMMDRVRTDEAVFITKMLSMFFGVSVLVIVVITEIINRAVIIPINKMANAAGNFAFDLGKNLDEGVSDITAVSVTSKDEVGDLYASICKMATDTSAHIREVEHQAKVIEKMQESIIMDFAEMVEARDKCTGDHIKKTSYYVGAIAEEMKKEGMYKETLTDDYIAHLKRSAPLHDVGKIKVSDIILNKPGRLTDEEFAIMKTHTTAGEEILKGSMSFAQNADYLKEAANMAAYHHEWWNGKGYPYGLSGEDIPLGARIMAVADVFDALISRRSYKEPFTFEKAISIIKEESGTHFDPDVVKAFLSIAEDLRKEI